MSKEQEQMYPFIKSVLEQDRCAVVLCDLEDRIVYMNPAAVKNYEKWGGEALLGRNLLDCHGPKSREQIRQVVRWFAASPEHNLIYTSHNEKENKDVYMVALRDGERLIGYYEKHEYRDPETMERYDFRAGGFPFEVRLDQPNKETIAAMLEAERIARDPGVKHYSDVEEALRELKR